MERISKGHPLPVVAGVVLELRQSVLRSESRCLSSVYEQCRDHCFEIAHDEQIATLVLDRVATRTECDREKQGKSLEASGASLIGRPSHPPQCATPRCPRSCPRRRAERAPRAWSEPR